MRVTLGFVGVMGGYCLGVFVFGLSDLPSFIIGVVLALALLDELDAYFS